MQEGAGPTPRGRSSALRVPSFECCEAEGQPLELIGSSFVANSNDKAPEANRLRNAQMERGNHSPPQCTAPAIPHPWKLRSVSSGAIPQLCLPSDCKGTSRIPQPKGRSGSALPSLCSSSNPSPPERPSSSVSRDKQCMSQSKREKCDALAWPPSSGIPSPSTFIAKRRRRAQALQ